MPTLQPRSYYEDAIKNGGVVQWHDGRTIYKVEDLPSEADLAADSESTEAMSLAEAKLLAEQKKIDDQLARVRSARAARPVAPAPGPDDKAEPPKSLAQPPATKGK